jgi:hypothetical protein
MNWKLPSMLFAILAAPWFLPTAPLVAQEGKEDGAAAAARAAMPGPVHKQLARLVGDYTTVTKFYVQPGATPSESDGTAKITSVLDGRFLMEENTGNMFGQPLKGLRYYGYNNGSKQYEGIWTYTRSTGIMTLTGKSSDDGKTINWTATYDDPRGKQTLYVVSRQLDDDHLVVELIAKNPDGKNGPTIETTYTRKK